MRSSDSLSVCVDDLDRPGDIFVQQAQVRARFAKDLAAAFEIEDTGDLEWVLGVRVTRNRRSKELTLSQHQYIMDLLSRHAPQVEISRKVDTPLAPEQEYSREQCPADGSPEKAAMAPRHTEYMTVVGGLLWLASFTRPDLTYAASVLARFVSNPASTHFSAMQRTLAYLHHTRDHVAWFSSPQRTRQR